MKITTKLIKQIIKEHKCLYAIKALFKAVKVAYTGIEHIDYSKLSESIWLKLQYQIMKISPSKWYSLEQGGLLNQAIWQIVKALKYCPNCSSEQFTVNHLYSDVDNWHCWNCSTHFKGD